MTSPQKAHFIGIAGIGMAATALLLREQGWTVTGSDEGFYPPASEILPAHGITVTTPHAAANIPADADIIVIGKHAKLTAENVEVAAAMASGLPLKSYPEVLAALTHDRTRMVVAGSYGKSTSASLLAWVLAHAANQKGGQQPGYFLGALPKNFALNAQLGAGPDFILEGDEYPSSNTDPRAKFLHYAPQMLLLTSAVHDHVNVFPTHAEYLAPFQELIARLPANGLLMVCADEPFARDLAAAAPCRVVTYSLSDDQSQQRQADYFARNIQYGETSTFVLHGPNGVQQKMQTTQLGAHNIQNMVGAAALLLATGKVTPAEIAAAYAAFTGVVRRMDKLTSTSAIPVYEGFGSSREKARAAIEAMQLHFPQQRLVIVFEPHTFSWRNRATLHWYDTVFAGADQLFIFQPPGHGAAGHAQLSHDEIIARVQATGLPVTKLGTDIQADLATITGQLSEGDVVLLLTSGDLGGLSKALVAQLDAQG